MLDDRLVVSLALLLVPPGLVALFCLLIYIGIRRNSNGLVIGSGLGLTLIGAPAALFGGAVVLFFPDQAFLCKVWFIPMGLVWAFLAFQGLNHANEQKGKALLAFSLLWAFWLPMPLEAVWKWSTPAAYLMVYGLAALGYIILGILVKLTEAARVRKEALYKLLMEEVDTQEKPSWDSP